MADLALPSAVSLLEAQIERKKATGQRFPNRASQPGIGTAALGAVPTLSGPEHFRSARCAPNEQVRMSVKAHPSNISRHDPPPEIKDPQSRSPGGRNRGMQGETSMINASMLDRPIPQITRHYSKEEGNRFRMGVPQRVEPPKDLNTPARVEDGTMVTEHDENGGGEAATPEGILAEAKKGGAGSVSSTTGVSRRQAQATKLKDQEMLAFACRRANKTRNEALAYYNIGVMLDNDKEYEKANRCYEQYLQAARSAGDSKGEQLALNSLGINLQKLGQIETAIEMHSQHLQIADVPGKFVAHSNLGIAYTSLDEFEKSSINHRQALRYAIVMSSLVGESLACGNLGIIASKKGDVRTGTACMERHLKLSTALKDSKAQLDACQHLGQLANDAGDYQEAASYFQQARNLALDMGESKVASACKCRIGMAKGNAHYDEYLANMALKLDSD